MNNYLNEENRNKFNSIIEAFATIGFTDEDIENVIHVLISILFIGDIKFVNKSSGDAVKVQNNEIISHGEFFFNLTRYSNNNLKSSCLKYVIY
jgi:myosin heavy subunit